jgi:hypothetical protein
MSSWTGAWVECWKGGGFFGQATNSVVLGVGSKNQPALRALSKFIRLFARAQAAKTSRNSGAKEKAVQPAKRKPTRRIEDLRRRAIIVSLAGVRTPKPYTHLKPNTEYYSSSTCFPSR